MKRLVLIVAMLVLAGCAAEMERAEKIHQEYLAANAEVAPLKERLKAAQTNAVFACSNKRDCDKAFTLAKGYVQANTDYKIQFSDDTMIATYNGLHRKYEYDDLVSLKSTKTLGAGDSATIDLFASCSGLNGELGEDFNPCAKKLIAIYDGFKPYIEQRLK